MSSLSKNLKKIDKKSRLQSPYLKKGILYIFFILSFIVSISGLSNAMVNASSNTNHTNIASQPQFVSNNRSNSGTTDAVNITNITSVTKNIIANISSTKDFTKIGNINLKDIPKFAQISSKGFVESIMKTLYQQELVITILRLIYRQKLGHHLQM